jgi:hypothetical protein
VLLLFDEVLNFVNRHRGLAEPFYAFLQNLTVAMTGTTRGAAVISLPRSQVEMTDWDLQWQERITKVVRRVAKDLIANDEAEIGAGVRRRLFEHLGPERNQKRVAKMFADWCFEQGTLGGDFDRTERAEVLSKVKEAQEEAQEELWASYRYVILADNQEPDGLKVIDLGAGHASASETLCGRVIGALKSQALLNETVGAGYLERRWPPALKEASAWPLASLRQSFLNGALTRLMDPDAVLRHKIVKFVGQGDFALASGHRPDGTYDRIWYREAMAPEEVTFEADVFLLTQAKAQGLTVKAEPEPTPVPSPEPKPQPLPWPEPGPSAGSIPEPISVPHKHTLRLVGTIPPEVWNRLGTKVLPKLRTGNDLRVEVELSVSLNTALVQSMVSELRQILQDLDLEDRLRIAQDEDV